MLIRCDKKLSIDKVRWRSFIWFRGERTHKERTNLRSAVRLRSCCWLCCDSFGATYRGEYWQTAVFLGRVVVATRSKLNPLLSFLLQKKNTGFELHFLRSNGKFIFSLVYLCFRCCISFIKSTNAPNPLVNPLCEAFLRHWLILVFWHLFSVLFLFYFLTNFSL